MTREKEILSAARDYIGRSMLSSPSYVIHFENGAKWADEHPVNVWHDASEEPQDRGKTLIISYTSIFDPSWWVFPNPLKIKDDWKRLVSKNKISKWAYVSDLIPKEEFESSYEKIG